MGIIRNTATDRSSFDVKTFTSIYWQYIRSSRLLATYVVGFKILFQQLWKRKVGSDEPLLYNVKKFWNSFSPHVSFLKDVNVLRCLFPNRIVGARKLHLFADASTVTYGTVVYVCSSLRSQRSRVK